MSDILITSLVGRILQLTPRALPEMRDACSCAAAVLPGFGITTQLRIEHFWAQILHESSGLSRVVENLNYTTPEQLMRVWPSRFRTLESARPYLRQPQKLANYVYGGRMGNVLPNDGWDHRGRGLKQITGKTNYRKVGEALGIDLIGNPDLAISPEYALPVACEIWRSHNCNQHADKDDVVGVTRAINGGLTGLEDRRRWLELLRRTA